jgi:tetratricopeptide (TPR) repeat protein
MTRDVFVSYSTEDLALAEEVVRVIEAAGIGCWIASRDIQAAANWAAEIEKAIREARAMVLIVSPDFNRSSQTPKEIILGIDESLPILPIRVVDFQPWSHLRYFLADKQWVDASGEKFASRLDLIVNVLRVYLARGSDAGTDTVQPGQPRPDGLHRAEELGILRSGAFLKLALQRPQRLSKQPSLWLQAYNTFVPMTGREPEMEELFQKLIHSEGSFRWWVMIGEAGMGKTRLAIEFARRMTSEGWHTGLLSGDDLKLFVNNSLASAWRPHAPTLLIVDYAASKVGDLRRLFVHLSAIEAEAQQEADAPGISPPVRVLLLERHADETRGWLNELLAAGEGFAGDLLSTDCYLGIRKLQPPGGKMTSAATNADLTRQIIENTFARWAAITGQQPPPMPAFTEKDWRSIQLRTGNRPLYLQMAALHACERHSAEQLPTWGRGELLKSAVERERDYVKKECAGNSTLRKAVEHVTAILCLAGSGAARKDEWMEAVGEKLHALGIRSIDSEKVEEERRNIFTEGHLGFGEAETGVIQPDIVSEGFAAQVLREEKDAPPIWTLKLILRLSGIKAWANLVRAVQDLSGLEEILFKRRKTDDVAVEAIDSWLPPLLADRPIEELYDLINVIPERSISLHGFALIVNEHLLSRVPAGHIAERAECLLSIATHRCRISKTTRGQIEQAVQELREAIGIFRQLPLDDGQRGYRLRLAKAYRMLDVAYTKLSDDAEAARNAAIGVHLASGGSPDYFPSLEIASMLDVALLQTPTQHESMLEFANCLNNLGIDLLSLQRNSEALVMGQRAAEVGEQLIAHDLRRFAPDLARYLNNLSLTQSASGDVLDAIFSSRRSAQIRAEFARENPDEYAEPLTLTLGNLVRFEYSQKNVKGAEEATEQLIAVYEDLAARDPASYREQLAGCYHNIGCLCHEAGNESQAISYTLEAIKIREELLESDFDAHALDLASGHTNAGVMYRKLGDLEHAKEHLDRADALRREWAGRAPGRQLPGFDEYVNQQVRSAQEKESGDKNRDGQDKKNDKAETKWGQPATDQDKAGPPHELSGMDLHNLARELGRLGRTPEGAAAALSAAEIFRRQFSNGSPEADLSGWANAGCNLASSLAMLGDWNEDGGALALAMETCQQALARLNPADPNNSFLWGALMHNLGQVQFRRGELLGRIDLVRQGLDNLKASAEQFIKLGNKEATEETNHFIERARGVLAKLEGAEIPADEPDNEQEN